MIKNNGTSIESRNIVPGHVGKLHISCSYENIPNTYNRHMQKLRFPTQSQ